MNTVIPNEAQLETARQITWKSLSHAQIAQLIADSEARAVANAFPDSGDDSLCNVRRLRCERDQLRAEVERLKSQRDNLLKPMREQAIARAERAEAILGKLQYLHGCSQEMVVHWCEHAAKRSLGLDAAQAELADEAIALRDMMSERDAAEAECERLKAEAEKEDRMATTTINQRDRAEDAADKLASAILGEDIDWSDHDAKWAEALEEAECIHDLNCNEMGAIARAERAEAECKQQAILNGKGSEREAALMGKVASLEAELAKERARLDWLFGKSFLVMPSATGFSSPIRYAVHAYTPDGDLKKQYPDADSERAAIDAAMKEGGK